MIIRICVVDPCPRDPSNDVIVYQVPERSRAHELLVELLEEKGLDWVDIVPTKRERDEQKEAKADADIRSV